MVLADQNHRQLLEDHRHTKSSSSIVSDATTFHSAHGEPRLLSLWADSETSTFQSPKKQYQKDSMPPNSTPMHRQDSGYSDEAHIGPTSSSRRNSQTSSSSLSRKSKIKTESSSRRSTIESPYSRPHHRRSSRASSKAVPTRYSPHKDSLSRPNFASRHTLPVGPQLFHFAVLRNPSEYDFAFDSTGSDPTDNQTPTSSSSPSPPPPQTVQYWTSDSTRRLEYAAIDAASRGMRGMFMKLIPDCMMPATARRTRFHSDDVSGSKAGSVRRYRLAVPEENEALSEKGRRQSSQGKAWWKIRPGPEKDREAPKE